MIIIDSHIVSFIVTLLVIGVAVIIIECVKRPDNLVKRPTGNKALMLCFTALAIASLACIPFGFAIPLLCVAMQAILVVVLELLCRSRSRTDLWHPSSTGESRDSALRILYAMTMVIELVSLAITFARYPAFLMIKAYADNAGSPAIGRIMLLYYWHLQPKFPVLNYIIP